MNSHNCCYNVIDSREICGIKVVIGHNPNSNMPFVCWNEKMEE